MRASAPSSARARRSITSRGAWILTRLHRYRHRATVSPRATENELSSPVRTKPAPTRTAAEAGLSWKTLASMASRSCGLASKSPRTASDASPWRQSGGATQ